MLHQSHPFPELDKFIKNKMATMQLDEETLELLKVGRNVSDHINKKLKIMSCNLTTQGEANKDMVHFVQHNVDLILQEDKSLLDRILLSAKIVEDYAAGNCQHKVFLATGLALNYFIQSGMADLTSTPSLRIQYIDSKNDTEGHFFIILNNKVVLDPWAQLIFPLTLMQDVIKASGDSGIYKSQSKNFFYIDTSWNCFEAEKGGDRVERDPESTKSTYDLFSSEKNLKRKRVEETLQTSSSDEKEENTIKESPAKKPKY